jgi:hypothetical protein
MTAARDVGDCEAVGAAGLIEKPFDPSTLPRRIVEIVNGST